MLGYLSGQITAAVKEDIRLMRGHDPYPHPHNRIVLKGWALGTLRCGDYWAAEMGLEVSAFLEHMLGHS